MSYSSNCYSSLRVHTHSWPRQLKLLEKYRNNIFKTDCVVFALFKMVHLSQTDAEVHRLRGTSEIDWKNHSETSVPDQGNCREQSFITCLTFASVYHVFHSL